ncbi:Telomerase Cajal body protein 1 [Clonorchis sinensis]|uniref:WD repeat-containing protein 79 n=1 Tax=Clonorchis sinensis TaxID=79923 RepID=A0A3R7CCI5_CLOSI|nr:Telomerase Cajal body protein 1 [Clonorchis sinensis]
MAKSTGCAVYYPTDFRKVERIYQNLLDPWMLHGVAVHAVQNRRIFAQSLEFLPVAQLSFPVLFKSRPNQTTGRLKAIERSSNSTLRILVDNGGCSGFQYKFELTKKPTPGDRMVNSPVYPIDSLSSPNSQGLSSASVTEHCSPGTSSQNAVDSLIQEEYGQTAVPCDLSASTLIDPVAATPQPTNEDDVPQDSVKYITPLEAFISISEQNTQKVIEISPEHVLCNSSFSASESMADDSLSLHPDSILNPLSTADEVESEEMNEDVPPPPDWLRQAPKVIAFAEKEYHMPRTKVPLDNYLRGCQWSPDGSCILTNSRDNILRIFNLPNVLLAQETPSADAKLEEMNAVLTMRESDLVYDCTWYPGMSSADPSTCCLASTARRNPIRLWDAFTGTVRAMYRPINHMGDAISAYSVAFSADGQRLYAGFNRFMHVFDVSRPGRDSIRRPKLGQKPLQGGIISCIAVPRTPERQLYATGSYNGTVAMFAEPGHLIGRASGSRTGVTQVLLGNRFAKESGAPWYLAAGCRMDSRIFLWDARRLSNPLLVLHRRVENHQRFQFDLDPSGQYLFTGSQTGVVCVYDLVECLKRSETDKFHKPSLVWRAHSDCAHGLSIHPFLPVVATTAGQRRIRPPWSTASINRDQRAAGTSSVSDSSSDTDVEEANLTDDEASLLGNETGSFAPSESLPLYGRLTRLPSENRLSLWSFPLKEM